MAFDPNRFLPNNQLNESVYYASVLHKYLGKEFSCVIVYLDGDTMTELRRRSHLGQFCTYSLDYLSPGTKLTDWDLENGQYLNRVRTPVKPLSVRFDGVRYVQAAHFARVRGMANPAAVSKIVHKLNTQLDIYKDHIRDGIAHEWCYQELWRVYPRFSEDCLKPLEIREDGTVDVYHIPPFNLRQIMKELLPNGYDDEWVM